TISTGYLVARSSLLLPQSRAMTEPIDSSKPSEPAPNDRRAFPRRRARGSATFTPADKPMAPSVTVTLVNISHSGIGFIVAKELKIGERILIELPGSASTGRPAPFPAEVRWVCPGDRPGQFRVGCDWITRLSYADVL